MSEQPEMRPCPFCGGPAELRRSAIPRSVGFRAMCEPCGVDITRTASDIFEAETKAATLAAWNARAALSDTAGVGDRVVNAAKDLIVAVAYAAPPKMFGDVLAYDARVPPEFVTNLEAALAALKSLEIDGE